jgi:transposase-like protein
MSTASKNRVIVLTYLHGGVSVSELAQRHHISRQWLYILLARHRSGGLEALEPKSRASHHHPRRISDEARGQVVATFHLFRASGLDAGAISIRHRILSEKASSSSERSI